MSMMHTARELTRNFVDLMLVVYGFGAATAAIVHLPGGVLALILWVSPWAG